jgi:hypothetical protein
VALVQQHNMHPKERIFIYHQLTLLGAKLN